MRLIYHWLFPGVWMAFVAYWWISARWVKKIKKSEPRIVWVIRQAFSYAAIVLIAAPWSGVGNLGTQWLPHTRTTFYAGAALLIAGLGFAVWARLHLGRYWSATVSLKEEHRLIRSGPYRLARHPIYTGLIVGFAGTAVAIGEPRAFVGTAMLGVIYYLKSRREERFLIGEFGEEYLQYRQEVKALVPFLF